MRFLSLSLIVQLAFSPLAMAKEITYRRQGQSTDEFSGLKLARPDLIGYDEYLADHLVSREMKENLQAAYMRAQEHFLKSEISQIETDWRDVTAYAFKADWGAIQREMIQTAYMRLAQVVETSEETRQCLQAAHEFDDEYRPDTKLFPPPLVEQFNQIRKSAAKQTLSTAKYDGFTILLVNGVRFDLDHVDSIETSAGTKRVTFISPTYAHVGRVLDSNELASFTPQKVLLAAAAKDEAPKIREKISDYSVSAQNMFGPDASIETSPDREAGKHFYEEPKFWLITAAIAGATFLLTRNKNEHEAPEPSHRDGL